MLAVTQDPRWVQAQHLSINHCVTVDSFTHEHVHTLLSYLLIHPSWKDINFESPVHFLIVNGCEMYETNLIQELRNNGVQGSTFDEVYSSLVSRKEITTLFRLHPFYKACP